MDPVLTPMLISSLIGAGVQVASSVIGQLLSQGKTQEAEAALREASRLYDNVPLPGYEDFKEQVLGPSAMEGIQADPRAKEAQLAADGRLREMADGGGLLLADQAAQNKAMGSVNRSAQAARSRILQRMRGAGMAGSGAETQAMLADAQNQTNQNAEIGMETAGRAQKRVLDAMLERGRLGGQMRAQDWGEKSDVARARDEFARYNAAARERGQMMRNNLQTQRFQNDMAVRDRRYGARRDRAQNLNQSAQGDRSMWAGIGDGASDILTAWQNFGDPDRQT